MYCTATFRNCPILYKSVRLLVSTAIVSEVMCTITSNQVIDLTVASNVCPICGDLLFPPSNVGVSIRALNSFELVILFLCRHMVHAHCVKGGDSLPRRGDDTAASLLRAGGARSSTLRHETLGSKIA